jgi:hypothetical protein
MVVPAGFPVMVISKVDVSAVQPPVALRIYVTAYVPGELDEGVINPADVKERPAVELNTPPLVPVIVGV